MGFIKLVWGSVLYYFFFIYEHIKWIPYRIDVFIGMFILPMLSNFILKKIWEKWEVSEKTDEILSKILSL